MKLLLIITPFCPSQTPNTLRWEPLVNYYANKGIQTTVLTTKNKQKEDTAQNVKYSKKEVGYNTLLDWLYFKTGKKTRRNIPGQQSVSLKSSRSKRAAEKMIDHTWRAHYWPDGSQLFLKPGIQEAHNIVKDDGISHVISVGLPFTCHLIALSLKESFPHLHWHQDIQDPFSYSEEFWVNNFKKYRSKNIEIERKAFEYCDSVSVTNTEAGDRYKKIFGDNAHKLKVIPPMFAEYKKVNGKSIELDRNRINIGFFGSFYETVRSPQIFLEFINKIQSTSQDFINDISLHFIGQQNRFSIPIFESFSSLKPHIKLHGFIDRNHSIAAMKQMDFILNFGNTTDYHLPSKLPDYLYINKPIINIMSIENDASAHFLKDYPDLCNLLLGKDNDEVLVKNFIDFIKKGRTSTQPSIDNVAQYMTQEIAKQYLNALQTSK